MRPTCCLPAISCEEVLKVPGPCARGKAAHIEPRATAVTVAVALIVARHLALQQQNAENVTTTTSIMRAEQTDGKAEQAPPSSEAAELIYHQIN
jgi:hypothetical protein